MVMLRIRMSVVHFNCGQYDTVVFDLITFSKVLLHILFEKFTEIFNYICMGVLPSCVTCLPFACLVPEEVEREC